jgi:hypothetical protein
MNANAVNVLSKSRVRENFKHGSVGAFIANELKINLKESML